MKSKKSKKVWVQILLWLLHFVWKCYRSQWGLPHKCNPLQRRARIVCCRWRGRNLEVASILFAYYYPWPASLYTAQTALPFQIALPFNLLSITYKNSIWRTEEVKKPWKGFFFPFLNFQKAVYQLTNFDIVLLNISKYQPESNEQKATEFWLFWEGKEGTLKSLF